MTVEDALQMCSAPSPDFTGGEWCYAANTLAQEVRQLQDALRLRRTIIGHYATTVSELEALLVELARWSRVAELNGDLHARIASSLALSEPNVRNDTSGGER